MRLPAPEPEAFKWQSYTPTADPFASAFNQLHVRRARLLWSIRATFDLVDRTALFVERHLDVVHLAEAFITFSQFVLLITILYGDDPGVSEEERALELAFNEARNTPGAPLAELQMAVEISDGDFVTIVAKMFLCTLSLMQLLAATLLWPCVRLCETNGKSVSSHCDALVSGRVEERFIRLRREREREDRINAKKGNVNGNNVKPKAMAMESESQTELRPVANE